MGAPIRILHLDDNPQDAQLVALTLEQEEENFPTTIQFVQTREEYLAALKRKDFDLILSDYRMPGYNGDQALAAAQEICPEIPFIMVTGELGEERVIETLKRGATDYVLKDRIFRLVPAIKRALSEAENEKKRAEAEAARERLVDELGKRHAELLAVIQAMEGGVTVLDMNGDVVLVNEAEVKMLGYKHASDLMHNLSKFVELYEFKHTDGKLVPFEEWPVTRVMRGETIVGVELSATRKDTGRHWFFSFSGQPVLDASGKQILSVVVARDITERKKAEGQLRKAERTTGEILESVQDPFYGLDSQWRFTYVNSKAEEFMEKSRVELLGKSIWEVFPRVLGTESERILRIPMESRRPLHREYKSVLKGVWISIHVFPKADGGLSVLYRDINDRKASEEALRLSEERFAATFRASPYPLALSRVSDGKFFDVNEALLELYGASRDEVIGKTSLELGIWIDPIERDRYIEILKRKGSLHDFETRIATRTHGERVVLLSVSLLEAGEEEMMLTIVNDITERKQADEALKESEQRLQQLNRDLHTRNLELDAERLKWQKLIEGIADEVWVCDAEGKMSMANLATKAAMGLEEFTGRSLNEVLQEVEILHIDGTVRPGDEAPLLRSLKGEVVRGEEVMRHKQSGTVRVRQYSSAPVRDAEGTIIGAVAIVRDVTEAKEAEAAVRRLNEELEVRVKRRTAALERANQELEAFIFTIPHELKAPLRVIEGFLGLLRKPNYVASPEKQSHYLDAIQLSTTQMAKVIESLLAFASTARQVPKKVPLDMSQLAKDVLQEQLQALGVSASRVHLTIGEMPRQVSGDPVLLRQVFANLLANALKFTRYREEPLIEMGGYRRNGDAVYFVRDNGVGFPPNDAEKLFQVFQRLHPQYEGTGIGLANVRKIVERHGGEVCAEGEVEKGATFYFALPVSHE